MFTRAIVRPPARNFAEGLTSAALGAPNYGRALEQHEAYCAALLRCGLEVTRLEPDTGYPDSTFVEDVAIVTRTLAILTRPGAPSRTGEVEIMRRPLANFFDTVLEIQAPGTVDGGDICQAGDHFFIGVSDRTNETGAKQLAALLKDAGYESSLIDMRQSAAAAATGSRAQSVPGVVATGSLLHLKSGIAYLGNNRLAITKALSGRSEFAGYDLVHVDENEEYAANCVRINDYVLIAAGFPKFQAELDALGYQTIALEMSEFQKMDGGLSCLSLRL
ncbi:MAG TPA: hypothetical protein VFU37_15705 [Pyrinomonadaceae bacterium]|nr:hypothetical protein [Pyrinomonadaceae bacterium]